MTASPTKLTVAQTGFSLLELSVALAVIALLASTVLTSLSSQRQTADEKTVNQQLIAAQDSLLAFAITQGRLPCPAMPGIANDTPGAGLEACPLVHGVLPWATLGLPETDPWGQRLTYFASTTFTRQPDPGEAAGFSLASGVAPNNTGLANIDNLPRSGGNRVAIELAAVLVSHGRQGGGAYRSDGKKSIATRMDEMENADADLNFIADAHHHDFDDHLNWISPNTLKARLIAAGKLP